MTISYSLSNITANQILQLVNFFADHDGSSLLYSGGEHDSARYSYVGLFPYETLTIFHKQIIRCKEGQSSSYLTEDPWACLQQFFNQLLPQEYAFGFLGYEMGSFVDPDYSLPYYSASTPDAYWQRCAFTLIYEHHTCLAFVTIHSHATAFLTKQDQEWLEIFTVPERFSNWLVTLSFTLQPSSLTLLKQHNRRSTYLSTIQQIKEFIRAGDLYQVNLSQQFLFQGIKRPFDAFYQLIGLNPAPFSAYLCLPGCTLVSTSPERFLHKKGNCLETRPIKGTMRRGATEEEDQGLKEQLLNSPKERAELLMITDLMRNDLGKISQIGSVKTQALWHCEAYANVFHLLSIIQSQPLSHLASCDLIRHTFPGGSITGCPKYRAMEAIAQLEQKARGVYTGSIGYMKGNGDFDLNIAIRTLVFQSGGIDLRLGGGIVIDSDPENEYEETLVKGQTIFNVLSS